MLKAGNHFAKIFLSFYSLKGNKNKENERQGGGRRLVLYIRTFIFNANISFHICLVEREGDPPSTLTQIATAYSCVGETCVQAATDLLLGR